MQVETSQGLQIVFFKHGHIPFKVETKFAAPSAVASVLKEPAAAAVSTMSAMFKKDMDLPTGLFDEKLATHSKNDVYRIA